MGTRIYRSGILGSVEVDQSSLDFWCNLCQFPIQLKKCQDRVLIQMCWDHSESKAGKWHQQRECPFIHKGQRCRCNDFRSIAEAFKATGLEYKVPVPEK